MVGPIARAYVFNPPTRSFHLSIQLHHATTTKKVHEPGPTFYPLTSRDATCLPDGTMHRRFPPQTEILNVPTLHDIKGPCFCFPPEGVSVISSPSWPSCRVLNTASFRTRHVTVSHWRKRRNIGFPPQRPPLHCSSVAKGFLVSRCENRSQTLLVVFVVASVSLNQRHGSAYEVWYR